MYRGEDESDADFEIRDPPAGTRLGREVTTLVVISGNTPNPFRTRTLIRLEIPEDGWVQIGVYDIAGGPFDRPVDGPYSADYHPASWPRSWAVTVSARPRLPP